MARKHPSQNRKEFKPPWKMNRKDGGVEWYSYPSALARQLLLYPRAIGLATSARGFKNEHHSDDGYLLHFMQQGKLSYRVNAQTYTANAGDACLLDVGEDVSYRNDGPGRAKFYWVFFSGRDMQRFFQELRADRQPLFAQVEALPMRTHFRELIALIQHSPQGFDLQAAAILTMLLARLFAACAPSISYTELSGAARPLSESVRKAIDFVSRFYDSQDNAQDDKVPPFSIKALADASGRSLHYFSRLFHHEVGMSPIVYLNRFRVEQAKRLLADSDRTVTQIARRVGFPEQNYFARTFKQITGMTPQRYRSQIQKTDQ